MPRGNGKVHRQPQQERVMLAPTSPGKQRGPSQGALAGEDLLAGYASNIIWCFAGQIRTPRVPDTDGQREMLAQAVRTIRYEERKRRTP